MPDVTQGRLSMRWEVEKECRECLGADEGHLQSPRSQLLLILRACILLDTRHHHTTAEAQHGNIPISHLVAHHGVYEKHRCTRSQIFPCMGAAGAVACGEGPNTIIKARRWTPTRMHQPHARAPGIWCSKRAGVGAARWPQWWQGDAGV